MTTPDARALTDVIGALRVWQTEASPIQLHPGDVGWNVRFGEAETAAALRVWSGDAGILAVGLLDGADLVRLTTAPELRTDARLAGRLADDLDGILPEGTAAVEAPQDAVLHDVLGARGWRRGEAWTPLRRDLAEPVQPVALRVETIGPELAAARAEVHRAAFPNSTFTAQRWGMMAAGAAYADARCLLGLDAQGTPVAAITVWSAGPGRPGLIEPMGVHPDHRGHRYGTEITVAGAAALRELGSSSAVVATPSANVGGVATYLAAGFEAQAERYDRTRPLPAR
ncbi:GNAT family N-acetyltransferase [Microbacterium mangrovi]|nr:GNAT family N-acetyltransferase [Microbacterium mangrovi]